MGTSSDHADRPTSSTAPALRFIQVRKVFRGGRAHIDALRRVSFDLSPGEFAVLKGPSGSGKSTLIHLAAGLETPTEGSVSVAGTDLADLDDEGLSRLRCDKVGLVFQSFHLIDYLNAAENVALPLRFAGIAARDAVGRASDALAAVGLSHRATHRPSELSGGEMQRVAIARALVVRPKLLLADEPTGNLDSTNSAQIMELLREINVREGVAILLATHDERAAESAPRLLELRDGTLVGDSHEARRSGT